MKINFGSKIFESEAPGTVYDAAKEAFEVVERSVIAATVNGETVALNYEINSDADVKLLTFADAEGWMAGATALDLSNATTAATMLKNTYSASAWVKG